MLLPFECFVINADNALIFCGVFLINATIDLPFAMFMGKLSYCFTFCGVFNPNAVKNAAKNLFCYNENSLHCYNENSHQNSSTTTSRRPQEKPFLIGMSKQDTMASLNRFRLEL